MLCTRSPGLARRRDGIKMRQLSNAGMNPLAAHTRALNIYIHAYLRGCVHHSQQESWLAIASGRLVRSHTWHTLGRNLGAVSASPFLTSLSATSAGREVSSKDMSPDAGERLAARPSLAVFKSASPPPPGSSVAMTSATECAPPRKKNEEPPQGLVLCSLCGAMQTIFDTPFSAEW